MRSNEKRTLIKALYVGSSCCSEAQRYEHQRPVCNMKPQVPRLTLALFPASDRRRSMCLKTPCGVQRILS